MYNIPDATSVRVNKSTVSGYPNDTYTNPNDFIHKLNGNGTKVGTSIVLKVMAGDKFNVRANSWYKLNGANPQSPINPLNDLLTALIGGVAGTGKAAVGELTSSGVLTPGMQNFLTNQTYTSGKPRAYLNWVLFDEQLKFVSTGSGFEQVGNDNTLTTHLFNNLPVTKNGYLYIYVSNETPNINVFFDNLQVTHIRGPILEETHYYPFGLPMAGITSKAASTFENRNKFNGKEMQTKEFSDGSGLEMYDFKYRFYDMQLGRFFNQDGLADKFVYMSPYQFCSNNPIWLREIDGLEGVKYTEVDNNGNNRTVVEKNIVVLTENKKTIPAGATQKQIDKINRQNTRIEKSNNDRIEATKSELNTFFNGSDGKGATDSKGNAVVFKFNVSATPDFDKKGMSQKDIDSKYIQIGKDAGIDGTFTAGDGVLTTIRINAGVLTNESSGADLGRTSGATVMRMGFMSPVGTFSHEVAHTLGLNDNGYTSGGILNSPPQQISSSEVDLILKFSYVKKK